MNTEKKQTTAEIEKPKGKPLHETEEIKTLREYMMPIAAGVLIALAAVLVFGVYQSRKAAQVQLASAAMMQAKNIEDIQKVAADYPNTPTGPTALLALANNYLQSGQPLMAKSSYEKFLKEYPKHPLKPAAELGVAYSVEAEGNLDAALKSFQAYEEKYPEYYMTPQAVFSQGRCLEQMGQYDDAKAIYEDFIVTYPDSRWTDHARTAILYTERAKRAKANGSVIQQQITMEQVPMQQIPVTMDTPPASPQETVLPTEQNAATRETAPPAEEEAPETTSAQKTDPPAKQEIPSPAPEEASEPTPEQ